MPSRRGLRDREKAILGLVLLFLFTSGCLGEWNQIRGEDGNGLGNRRLTYWRRLRMREVEGRIRRPRKNFRRRLILLVCRMREVEREDR
jgi:hypothetical protein